MLPEMLDTLRLFYSVLVSESPHLRRQADLIDGGDIVRVRAMLADHIDIITGARASARGDAPGHLARLAIDVVDPDQAAVLNSFARYDYDPTFDAATFISETNAQLTAVKAAVDRADPAATLASTLRSAATEIEARAVRRAR